MPIYVYVCEKCANREEHIQKFSDPPLTTCSACHSETLAKKVTSASFHLRGGGWYKDGYASTSGDSSSSVSSSSVSSSSGDSASSSAPTAASSAAD